MTSTSDSGVPACAVLTHVFQHPFLEEDSTPSTAEQRRLRTALTARATEACMACPYFEDCLDLAVTKHDVSGFVAATTSRQRAQMRNMLRVEVTADDMDALIGVIASGRQIATRDVVALRRAHPDESLDFIAQRLGCSLSTVKRHLRRARAAAASETETPRRRTPEEPDRGRLITAFESVTGMRRRAEAAA
ncbi:sigma factor-like helix-turn-helix DNA-binding protein [Acidipropionibacterium virtanenii]|uniref:Transcriptional regulator WhiB n=1 Tax=Acidipropionibacterium virtanenii TaxID=2057246 RepID=A0A344UQQ3_9ACTN|nr:Transcriptional regulator WhiB [Acidipropionibacterium virtanenii]